MKTTSGVDHFKARLRQFPSRIEGVYKTIHLDRILRKHCSETNANHYQKEFSTEQWIKMLLLGQIKGQTSIRPFVEQLTQNLQWQRVCGLYGNVPVQSQFSRRLVDPKLHEVLDRTFLTYQKLIPHSRKHFDFIPQSWQLEMLEHGYRPFKLDCTSIELSQDRYDYAEIGYVATKKEMLPSGRLNTLMEGFHGIIVNYQPAKGNQHESPLTDELFKETECMEPWLKEFPQIQKLRPFQVMDRGYWNVKRFKEFDRRNWGWSIPRKKKSLVGAQFELLDFPSAENHPLEILVWEKSHDRPWRRIIGKRKSSDRNVWDILTNNLSVSPLSLLHLQKERWEIEEVFSWLKKHTGLKRPLGTTWASFVTHCFLIVLLHLILVYFLLLLGFKRWQNNLTRLLRDLRFSDDIPWREIFFKQNYSPLVGGGH